MSQRLKNITSLLFLSAFILLRIGNAHAFAHDADHEEDHHCELCEILQLTNDSDDLIIQPSFEVPTPSDIPVEKDDLNSEYTAPVDRYILPDKHLNRPPPAR